MYPNVENMVVVPITKRMEIIMGIQVYLFSRMNFDFKENGGKKSFSCKSKASMSCIRIWRTLFSANNKKNRDYYEYPSLYLSRINFDYKENRGKKSCSCKSKASISHNQTNIKKNKDYYECPCLSHFTDKL